jgi:phage terminase large subunit
MFHASEAYETFYGGAAGPGKTAAICAEAVTTALESPGTHVYIFRRTVPELRNSILPEIQKQCAAYLKNMPYNSEQRRFVFNNGSFIQLAYLDNPGDQYRYQSAEIHLLMFDELTHFTQDEYEYLKTRVRAVEDRLLRVMCASNPGGVGHGWVKSYFVDCTQPGEVFYDEESKTDRVFIPALIDDHPIKSFREKYRRTLEAIPDPDLKKALLEGDWNIFSGQVFTEWRRAKHTFAKLPVDLQDCKIYAGLDWGYNDPTAVYWVAVTPEDERGVIHYYVYRELYANQKRPEDWAYEIGMFLRHEPIEYLAMPHDTYSNLGGTKPIVDQFRDIFNKLNIRVNMIQAPTRTHTDKINRQALMHQLLGDSADGRPHMMFHDSCANAIRTIPMLVYSDNRPEEINDKSEDHAYDGVSHVVYTISTGGGGRIINPRQPGESRVGYMVEDDQYLYHVDWKQISKELKGQERGWKYQ